jgi:tetratricopeptide (TPR) repeat protein
VVALGVLLRRGGTSAPISSATSAPAAALEEARLRAAAAASPGSAPARQALGRYYLDHGLPFEAIWELRAAHGLAPDDSTITVQLAVALAAGSLYDAAIEQLETLTARRPASRDGRVQLATLYIGKARPQRAIALLQASPDLDQWPEGLLTVGKAHQAAGETDAALAAYRRALALAPASEELRVRLGSLYLQQGQVSEARRVLQGEASAPAPSPRQSVLLAESSLGKNGAPYQPAQAEQWLRRALAADASHVPALVASAQLIERQGRRGDALRAYADALRLSPGDVAANEGLAKLAEAAGRSEEAHAARARAFRSRGLPTRAIAEYEALARTPARYREAVLEMSLLLVQTRRKQQAARLLEKAVARQPLDVALYERLVVLQLVAGKYKEAERSCDQWQQLEPRSHRPVWLRGQAAADQGNVRDALRLLEEVIAAEPQNTDYPATLADILLREPYPPLPRVRALLEHAVTAPEPEPKTHMQLARTLQLLGEYDAARWQALRALDRDPSLPEPYAMLAQLARQLRQPDQLQLWVPLVRWAEARRRREQRLSRRTWDHPTDPVAYRDLGLYQMKLVELRKAESQFEEALRLRPGWEEVQQLLEQVRRMREVL